MKHRIGIIGYGNMGSWHGENITSRIENLDVGAVYDINPERLEIARKAGFTTYDTVEEFLASDIDIVLVATPNNFHKYYSIMAMEAGKHVVSEKPVCMNTQELEDVLAVCQKTGMRYTVHQNRRWDTDFVTMKNIFDQKLVGKGYFLNSRLFSSRGMTRDWKSTYEAGGGIWYDWGVHMVDQVLMLAGCEPVSVYAQLQNVWFPEVDDSFRVLIDFENGLRAQVVTDLWCYIEEPRWHLSGNEGTATIYKWFGKEGSVTKLNVKTVEWQEGCVYTPNGLSKTMWPRPVSELEEIPLPVPEQEPRWEEFYENFMDCIEGKAEQIVTHEQMRRALKVIEAGFASARENRVVYL